MAFFQGEKKQVFLLRSKKGKQKQKKTNKQKTKKKEGLGPSEVALWATSRDPTFFKKNVIFGFGQFPLKPLFL